jgi:hypothetical protein
LEGRECGGQWSWTETLLYRRNSDGCDGETQVGEREESGRLENENLTENNRREEVVASRYTVVKIPLAEPD